MTGVWQVTVLRRDRVQVQKSQVTEYQEDTTVWCPVVGNTYFVARRAGTVYITGNTVIQGGAADINKIAMIDVHKALREFDPRCKMLLTVHDEIVSRVPKDIAEEAAHCVKTAMEAVGTTVGLPVPLVADVKIVKYWSDAK